MPKITLNDNQMEYIPEILYLATLCEKPNFLDKTNSNNHKNLKENIESIHSNISYEKKKKILKNCRFGLQRLLLNFLDSKILKDFQINTLNEINNKLGNPIIEPKTEGNILIQIKELNGNHKYFYFKLHLNSNNLEYEFR